MLNIVLAGGEMEAWLHLDPGEKVAVESCSRTAVGFLNWAKGPGSCRLSHPVHGRTYKKSEIIATGNLYKHHRGKKVGAELLCAANTDKQNWVTWRGPAGSCTSAEAPQDQETRRMQLRWCDKRCWCLLGETFGGGRSSLPASLAHHRDTLLCYGSLQPCESSTFKHFKIENKWETWPTWLPSYFLILLCWQC